MPLTILPVRPSDIHEMVLFRIAAMEQSPTIGPFWHQLRGKCDRTALISTQEKALRDSVMAALAAPNRKFLKVVDGDGHDAEIVSYCQWAGPVGEKWEVVGDVPKVPVTGEEQAVTSGQEEAEAATMAVADGANVEALAAINAEEIAMNDRMWHNDGMRCFGLTNLITSPKHQGRGAASLLVKYGLAIADAAHLPVVLQADPDGYKIYKRHGFEDFGVWRVDLAKYGGEGVVYNTGMVRPAQW